ncbi:MAG: helix-turn-helix domain-containing protein [Elusimicrobiota bacterium]
MDDIKKYLTVRQVARKLGLTEEWIRDLITKKEIKAVKIGQWKINPQALAQFIKSRSNIR